MLKCIFYPQYLRKVQQVKAPKHLCMSGFNIIELIVLIAIIAILSAIAAPNFTSIIDRQAVAGAVQELRSALSYARSEAIATGLTIEVCSPPEPTQKNCAGTTTNWKNGWIVYNTGSAEVLSRFKPSSGVEVTSDKSTVKFVANEPIGNINFDICKARTASTKAQARVTLIASGLTEKPNLEAGCK